MNQVKKAVSEKLVNDLQGNNTRIHDEENALEERDVLFNRVKIRRAKGRVGSVEPMV